ncbi:DUF1932 domain-containing protein [Streptomyces sp. NPDC005728]|uniref:DUF1932 domain-containing protein n=1 Tax=Streptomyces sp. NPDC005728 TaxID=3157054 RepID=UPI0033C12F90
MTTITLLFPDPMGTALGACAVQAGARVLWVPPEGGSVQGFAQYSGMLPCSSLADALARSDLALSYCPPNAAFDVARNVTRHHFRGVYVDANAISPVQLSRIQELLAQRGIPLVDAVVIGPRPGGGRQARLYACGEPHGVDILKNAFGYTDVDVRRLDGPLGTASALKAAFAGFHKTSHMLAAICHALANAYGVGGELAAEARALNLRVLASPRNLPDVAARAWRWEPELREIADTLASVGLPPDLAAGAASAMARWTALRDVPAPALTDVLDWLRSTPQKPASGVAALFVHGRFRSPVALQDVLGRVPDSSPAVLHGWEPLGSAGETPLALRPSAASVEGLLVDGLSPRDYRAIDAFADLQCDLRPVLLADGRQAWAYVRP